MAPRLIAVGLIFETPVNELYNMYIMNREVHFLVTRHAKPENNIEVDPGINKMRATKDISSAAWTIFSGLEDVNTEGLVIFTSPKRRAIETAYGFAESNDLSGMVVGQPVIDIDLDDRDFDIMSRDERTLKWAPVLERLAQTALSMKDNEKLPSILLITHEPIIRSIPQLDYGRNLNNLGINEFTTQV